MVEEALKSFLVYARDVNRIAPAEYASISKSDDELDEMPLSGLIALFRRAVPSSCVLSNLERLRPERNHCAHRALVLCFMSDVDPGISLEKEFQRICDVRRLAWGCFEELKPEIDVAEKRFAALQTPTNSGQR